MSHLAHIIQDISFGGDANAAAASQNSPTGFPEPFNHDRNTTLRHPSADTSKNCTIEAGDLELVRTRSSTRGYGHSRGFFLHARHHSQRSEKNEKIMIMPGEASRSEARLREREREQEKMVRMGSETSASASEEVLRERERSREVSREREEEAEREELEEEQEEEVLHGDRKKGVFRKLFHHG